MAVIPFPTSAIVQDRDAKTSVAREQLAFAHDDFSQRATLPGDDFFFVRMETDRHGDAVFTDFNHGRAPTQTLAKAIGALLGDAKRTRSMVFRNIHPMWRTDPVGHVEVQRRIRSLKATVALVPGFERDTTRFDIFESRGHLNMRVTATD